MGIVTLRLSRHGDNEDVNRLPWNQGPFVIQLENRGVSP